MNPEEVLAAYRREAGYDADLGASTEGGAFLVAAILDFVVFALGAGALFLLLYEIRGPRLNAGRIGGEVATLLVALVLVLVGRPLANPDRDRRRLGVPGSATPSRAYGLFTGLLVHARVRRRMRVQDAEPHDPRRPEVLAPAFEEEASPLRVWARERLREGDDPALRTALARLDAPLAPGEDALERRVADLRALRRLLVEEAGPLEASSEK